MIALDTSAIVAFLSGERGAESDRVDAALAAHAAVLPAVVLSELLSNPDLPPSLRALFLQLPLLEPSPGFWERAGDLRAALIARGHKANLADTLIAQSCLDYHAPLIARDQDFRHFAAHGLALL